MHEHDDNCTNDDNCVWEDECGFKLYECGDRLIYKDVTNEKRIRKSLKDIPFTGTCDFKLVERK